MMILLLLLSREEEEYQEEEDQEEEEQQTSISSSRTLGAENKERLKALLDARICARVLTAERVVV